MRNTTVNDLLDLLAIAWDAREKGNQDALLSAEERFAQMVAELKAIDPKKPEAVINDLIARCILSARSHEHA